jgi:drug/metabolite transporter (DMT)-like permease
MARPYPFKSFQRRGLGNGGPRAAAHHPAPAGVVWGRDIMARGGVLLPSLAAAVASVFFGATVVAVRSIIDQTDPLTVALLRHLVGTLLILPVLLFVARPAIDESDRLPIVVLGIGMFGLFSYCSAGALQYIYAARGALILTTMPLLTLLVACLFRQERFTLLKLVGICLTILGVAVALGSNSELGGRPDAPVWKGDLLMFTASFVGALYNAFSPRYLRKYPALLVTVYSMIAGTLFLLAVSSAGGLVSRVAGFTPHLWAVMGFIGAFGAAGGFFLWVWALERMAPTRVVVFFAINPLAATVLGAWLLSEPVTAWFLLGLVFVLSGIFIVNRDRGGLPVAPHLLHPSEAR